MIIRLNLYRDTNYKYTLQIIKYKFKTNVVALV